MRGGRRRWLVTAAVVLAVGGVAGIGIFSLMLSSWSDLAAASPEEAETAFHLAREQAGGGPAYLEVTDAGEVRVRRELERAGTARLQTLHLLAWEPERGQLLRIAFPFWFVRAKMTESLNLGTLTAALAGDWGHLDLRVAERDLERRGPGVVLDHQQATGGRVLLWTE